MDKNYTPVEKAWIKLGYWHAKGVHESLEEEFNRIVSVEELQEDTAIQETGEIIYSGSALPDRNCFDSDEEYENAEWDLDLDECWNLFIQGIDYYIKELKSKGAKR